MGALEELSAGGANIKIHKTTAGAVERRANGAYLHEAAIA